MADVDLPTQPAGGDGHGRGEVPPAKRSAMSWSTATRTNRAASATTTSTPAAGLANMTPTSLSTTTARLRSGSGWATRRFRTMRAVMNRLEQYDAYPLPLDRIYYDADFNCRGQFTLQSVSDLAESIRLRGGGSTEGTGLPDCGPAHRRRGRQGAGGFRLPADCRASPLSRRSRPS